MLVTLPDARIATVPVPLKLTHARHRYEGVEPEGVASSDVPSVTLSVNVVGPPMVPDPLIVIVMIYLSTENGDINPVEICQSSIC